MSENFSHTSSFVVYDDQAIWGIGPTEEQAWAEANEFSEIGTANMMAAPATEDLLNSLKKYGPDLAGSEKWYALRPDGVMDLMQDDE